MKQAFAGQVRFKCDFLCFLCAFALQGQFWRDKTRFILADARIVCRRTKGEDITLMDVDEGRKRVLLIAASILAARRLAQYGSEAQVPATIGAIADAIRWAERIMREIDRRWPAPIQSGTSRTVRRE